MPLLRSSLKTMLATTTVVYVGYSLADNDFVRIHRALTSQMEGLRPHSYIVTLDANSAPRFSGMGVTPIVTDGTYFIQNLKQHLVNQKVLLSDQIFDELPTVLDKVCETHESMNSFDQTKYPTVILNVLLSGWIDSCPGTSHVG